MDTRKQVILCAAIISLLLILGYPLTPREEVVAVAGDTWVVRYVLVPASIDIDPPQEWCEGEHAGAWKDLWYRWREIGKMPISRSVRVIVGGEGLAPTPPKDRQYADGWLWRWWPIGGKRIATVA